MPSTKKAPPPSAQPPRRVGRPKKFKPSAPAKPMNAEEALADLGEQWQEAEASVLAGTAPPTSTLGALVVRHLEAPPAPAPVEMPDVFDDGSQDALVAKHRKDIADTRAIVMHLIEELDDATENKPVWDAVAAILADPVKGVDVLRERYMGLMSLPARIDMAKKLGDTLKALVPMERQAAGLSDGYVDAATERAKKETAATATVVATSFDAITGKFQQIMAQMKRG